MQATARKNDFHVREWYNGNGKSQENCHVDLLHRCACLCHFDCSVSCRHATSRQRRPPTAASARDRVCRLVFSCLSIRLLHLVRIRDLLAFIRRRSVTRAESSSRKGQG